MIGPLRLVSIGVAAVSLAMTACQPSSSTRAAPAYTGTIRIGVAAPLHGPQSGDGTTFVDGVVLAAEDVNADGGVLGQRIEVVVADDSAGAEGAAERIRAGRAVAVIGHLDEAPSLAAMPLYANAGIIQFVPTVTSDRLTRAGQRTVFRVCPAGGETDALAATLSANKIEAPVAVVEGGTPVPREISAVAVVRVGADHTSVVAALSATATTGGDATVLLTSAPVAGALLASARGSGIPLPQPVGPGTLTSGQFLLAAGAAAEGAIVVSPIPNRVSGAKANPDFVRHYRERFGRDPGFAAPAAYVAALTYLEGATAARSFVASEVADALHSADFEYDSMIGRISFTQTGDLVAASYYPQVVRDGKLEPD